MAQLGDSDPVSTAASEDILQDNRHRFTQVQQQNLGRRQQGIGSVAPLGEKEEALNFATPFGKDWDNIASRAAMVGTSRSTDVAPGEGMDAAITAIGEHHPEMKQNCQRRRYRLLFLLFLNLFGSGGCAAVF